MTKIACSQYKIEKLDDFSHYSKKVESLIQDAKRKDAELILLPEYAGCEIVCNRFKTENEFFAAIQPLIQNYVELYQTLSKNYEIYIQPGTIIAKNSKGNYVNRAYFFGPKGESGFQDKMKLIPAEKNLNIMHPGIEQKIFATSFGKIGIAICYDSEFPEIVRNLTNQGATLILVPSYTSSMAGFNRVCISARARAIENQCYVATSFVVKTMDLSAEADMTYGMAGIFAPSDTGFPDDGILAKGTLNEIELVFAEISAEKIAKVRSEGQVRNFKDWT